MDAEVIVKSAVKFISTRQEYIDVGDRDPEFHSLVTKHYRAEEDFRNYLGNPHLSHPDLIELAKLIQAGASMRRDG